MTAARPDVTVRAATPREDASGPRVKAVMLGRRRLGFVAPADYAGRIGETGKWTATARDAWLGNSFRTRADAVAALVQHDEQRRAATS